MGGGKKGRGNVKRGEVGGAVVQAGGPYIKDPRQANSTGKAREGHPWEILRM